MNIFPSHAHQKDLRHRAAVWGKDRHGNAIVVAYDTTKLGDFERKQYFAYDHAFHRVSTGDLVGPAPTDPYKDWWDDNLVNLAESQLRKELGISSRGADHPGSPPPKPKPPQNYDDFVQSLGVRSRVQDK